MAVAQLGEQQVQVGGRAAGGLKRAGRGGRAATTHDARHDIRHVCRREEECSRGGGWSGEGGMQNSAAGMRSAAPVQGALSQHRGSTQPVGGQSSPTEHLGAAAGARGGESGLPASIIQEEKEGAWVR